jgi:hypothetical protein
MIDRIVTFTRERTGLAIAVYVLIAIVLLQLVGWIGEYVQSHKIVEREKIGEQFQVEDTKSCSAPGFCMHPATGPDGKGGTTTKFVFGFYVACPGHKAGLSTLQRYRYTRYNGEIFERNKHLGFEPKTDCIT